MRRAQKFISERRQTIRELMKRKSEIEAAVVGHLDLNSSVAAVAGHLQDPLIQEYREILKRLVKLL